MRLPFYTLLFDSCLRLMLLNCFELHSVLRKEPCRERDKLGCLKYFRLSSKKQILSAYQITFKLEAYISSFPYKFSMRIKSLVRKRCAKVDSLLTSARQNFVNGWKKHETNFEKNNTRVLIRTNFVSPCASVFHSSLELVP